MIKYRTAALSDLSFMVRQLSAWDEVMCVRSNLGHVGVHWCSESHVRYIIAILLNVRA